MMNRDIIHIAIPAVGEYRRWAEVAAQSARRAASSPVEVHLLDWSNVDRAKMEAFGEWHGSAIAWSRLFIDELLPCDIDWVISCDADILYRGDIAKLWALRDERYVVMMSRDSQPPWRKFHPVIEQWLGTHPEVDAGDILCSGLTLINLRKWRAEGWQRRVKEFIVKYPDVPFLDQMALNVVFRDCKTALPREWGCFSGDRNEDVDYNGDCAIHYVGDTPWNRKGITRLMSDAVVLWRKEAGMPCGGWRRWLWLALRTTSPLWRWNKSMAWHFRTAIR